MAWSKIKPLANEFIKVFESPDPKNIYCGSPGLARCPSGRLVATMQLWCRSAENPLGAKCMTEGVYNQGKILTSDDHGKMWVHCIDFPFTHARPFMAGKFLYVLGHAGDLMTIRSHDEGRTWSEPAKLTHGQQWHQAPCNVHYTKGNVYLVMEKRVRNSIHGWPVGELAPILMRGKTNSDLTKCKSWTFASELPFYEAVDEDKLDYFGVPFFKVDPVYGKTLAPNRDCAPMGWLETNIIQIVDPDHYWYDPKSRTFHLWLRANTAGTGYAAIAKVVENEDGTMTTMLETVPSGKKILYVPCPGGNMKFHILYDEKTGLYWLLSSQTTDSMTRAEKLPQERYNLSNNERHRLQLHFSKNCIDWCFAGIVAIGASPKQSRHYASMVIDGDDLHILSRSGDEQAKSAHDGNLISFHTVKNFQELVY